MNSKIAIVLLAILLTACSTGRVETVTPFPTLFKTSTARAVSFTPTPALTKTPSPTTFITKTVAVATLNAAATTEAMRMNLINEFPELQDYFTFCSPGYCYGVQSSPNGQWIYLTNFETLDLFNAAGDRIGKYPASDIYGHEPNYCLGSMDGAHWSKDGRYLYISVNPCGDGGPEPYFRYASALIRVNLEDGTWKDIAVSGSFRFSPNDEYIIYSGDKGDVQVRPLSAGQEQSYSPSEYLRYFGNYVWSPDDKKIALIGTPEDWYADESKFVILMIDLENREILPLYESSFPFYYPVHWMDSDKVILNNVTEPGEWTLDLSADPPTLHP